MLPFESLPRSTPSLGLDHLAGVRVIDLTTSVAGPYATQLLADFGATVIKIEKPGTGDDARHWGPPFLNGESLWFMSVNRNKQSLALDISIAEGGTLLKKLIATADVLVANMTPRVQAKLGLTYEELSREFPGLIHASLTGFGLTGERKDWACYDLIAEGYAGIMDLTGQADGAAQKIGTPAADLLAGQDLALAVMASLIQRTKTGKGCCIDVSLVNSMTRFAAPRIMSYFGSGSVPRRSGGTDSVIAIYQVFETADLPISLGLGNDGIWERFWVAIGDPAFGNHPNYATNAGRREYRAEIVERIGLELRQKPRSYWLDLFSRHRIPAGPINRVDEIAKDEELLASGFFQTVADGERSVPQVGLGIRINGSSDVIRTLPPTLGQHTKDVLNELDIPQDEQEELRKSGVIS